MHLERQNLVYNLSRWIVSGDAEDHGSHNLTNARPVDVHDLKAPRDLLRRAGARSGLLVALLNWSNILGLLPIVCQDVGTADDPHRFAGLVDHRRRAEAMVQQV